MDRPAPPPKRELGASFVAHDVDDDFVEEGAEQFELTRVVQAKDPAMKPRGDADFDEKLFMQRGGRHLNADEVQTELNRMLPEQISRFFLLRWRSSFGPRPRRGERRTGIGGPWNGP